MPGIRVSEIIDCTPSELWDYIEDIGSHVEWMADAEEITFTSKQTQGTGTTFDCLTKIGPIKLNDKMTITNWVENKSMGVTHDGLVKGVGEFTLIESGETQTEFIWEEKLEYPIWMGGPIGAFISKPILKWVWNRNLKRLKEKFE